MTKWATSVATVKHPSSPETWKTQLACALERSRHRAAGRGGIAGSTKSNTLAFMPYCRSVTEAQRSSALHKEVPEPPWL